MMDFVFSNLGIHHASDPITSRKDIAFRELSRVLKKGGKAIVNLEGRFQLDELPKDLEIISNKDYIEKEGHTEYSHRVLILQKK